VARFRCAPQTPYFAPATAPAVFLGEARGADVPERTAYSAISTGARAGCRSRRFGKIWRGAGVPRRCSVGDRFERAPRRPRFAGRHKSDAPQGLARGRKPPPPFQTAAGRGSALRGTPPRLAARLGGQPKRRAPPQRPVLRASPAPLSPAARIQLGRSRRRWRALLESVDIRLNSRLKSKRTMSWSAGSLRSCFSA